MQVKLRLDEWKVKKQDDGSSKICGYYELYAGDMKIARQGFNDGYQETKIQFSQDTMLKMKELNESIKRDIQNILN